MRKSLRKGKREWINSVAHGAEHVAQQGQMKELYKATRRLCNEGPKKVGMVKSKEGRLLTKEGEVKARLQEHFRKVLKRLVPKAVAEVDETNEVNDSFVR